MNDEILQENELIEEHKRIIKKIKSFEIGTNKETNDIYLDMKKI